jgi:hypothetical protein
LLQPWRCRSHARRRRPSAHERAAAGCVLAIPEVYPTKRFSLIKPSVSTSITRPHLRRMDDGIPHADDGAGGAVVAPGPRGRQQAAFAPGSDLAGGASSLGAGRPRRPRSPLAAAIGSAYTPAG